MNTSALARTQEQRKPYDSGDFVRARKAALSCRDRVQKGRRQLVSQRVELQQFRIQIQRLEDDFVSALQHQSAERDAQFKLSNLLNKIKEMRKDLMSREYAYNTAEDALYSDEYELGTREDEFYRTFGLDSFDNGSQPSSANAPQNSETLHTTNEQLPLGTTNPLYDYERKIGWADYLHEKIREMIHDREEILEEQRQGDLSNERMDPDDLKFLGSYGETFAGIVKDLNVLEAEISSWEREAMNTGLLHPSDLYTRTRPWAANPARLVQPAIYASNEQSEYSSMMEVPVKTSHASAPATYIHQWLGNLRFTRTARDRTGVQNTTRPINTSNRPVSLQSERTYASVVKAHSDSELDLSSDFQKAAASR